MSKKNKPIGYTVGERKVGVGPNKGKVVIQATPSSRHLVSFERFCEMVAKDTTLNYMKMQSVLNLAADMACEAWLTATSWTSAVWGRFRLRLRARSCPSGASSMPTCISPSLA